MNNPWYLQVDGTEFGPLSNIEVSKLQSQKVLQKGGFLWRMDFENWVFFSNSDHLTALLGNYSPLEIDKTPTLRRSLRHLPPEAERRKSARHPIIATAQLTDPSSGKTHFATCVDISREGLQVSICQELKLENNGAYKVRITPVSLLKIAPLHLDAIVRWNNPKENRVGLEFGPMNNENEKSLIAYLRHQQKLAFG